MADELDLLIVQKLMENPEYTMEELANELGVSKGTVAIRIKKLRAAGIIAGRSVRVYWKALGHQDAFVGIDISPEKYMSVLDSLKSLEFVKEVYGTSGDHSAIVYIVEKEKDFPSAISKLQAIEGIRKVYPALVVNIVK